MTTIASRREIPSGSTRATSASLLAACLAVLAGQASITSLGSLSGVIQTNLGASGTALTWLTAIVFAPTAILELNFGVLGDLFGRKRLIVGGTAVISLGALVACLATTVVMLGTGLVLMGAGAAAVLPSTLATVAAPHHGDLKARAGAIAKWTLSVSVGTAISSLGSGILAQLFGLHYAFLHLLVLGALACVLSAKFVIDSSAPAGRSIDWWGQILCAIGVIAPIFAVIQGAQAGWSNPSVVSAFVVTAIVLSLFVIVELRQPAPMFQVRLLKAPGFRAAAIAGLLGMLSFMGTCYILAIKLGAIAHASPIAAGVPFFVLQLVPLALSRWLPTLLHRISPRPLLVSGLIAMACGQLWFAALPDGTVSLLPLLGPIVLLGVGFIVMFSSLTAAAINSVPHEALGMASGATSLVREAGTTLGPAIVGAVALTHAGSLFSSHVAGLGLDGQQSAVVDTVAHAGGPLALASVQLPGGLSEKVGPVAVAAVEGGFDLALVVLAIIGTVAAILAALLIRGRVPTPDELGLSPETESHVEVADPVALDAELA